MALVLWELFVASGSVQGLWLNLGTEILGAVLTYTLLTSILDRKEKQEEEEHKRAEYKRDMIRQMGSPVNDAALEAVRIARLEGWHMDGSLDGAYLMEANLKRANLEQATLRGAYLMTRNHFRRATLQEANLQRANLEGA